LRVALHVEVDGVSVGSLYLIHNAGIPSGHKIKLDLNGETVLMWHFATAGNHRNYGCPRSFPPRIRKQAHEHVWTPGGKVRCARPLDGVDGLGESEHLGVFCVRLNVDMRVTYVAPVLADQMVIPFEEET